MLFIISLNKLILVSVIFDQICTLKTYTERSISQDNNTSQGDVEGLFSRAVILPHSVLTLLVYSTQQCRQNIIESKKINK